ncbi:MAG: alpha/beta hydrolase, partial [Candidatus Anstonellales archaeon]
AKIAYSETRPEKSTNTCSVPIVILSGYLCFPNIWRYFVDELKRHFRIIRIRTRGHFESELGGSNAYTYIKDAAADLEVIRLSENIDKMILIGHSMGGLISLNYISQYGHNNLSGLVLVSSPFGDPFKTTYFGNLEKLGSIFDYLSYLLQLSNIDILKRMLGKSAIVKRISYSLITGTLLKNSLNGIDDKELEYLIKLGSTIREETIAIALRAMRKLDLKKCVEEISIPCLIIAGINDLIVNWKNAVRVFEIIKSNNGNANLCFLPCGHMPMMEFPNAFNYSVINFMCSNIREVGENEEIRKILNTKSKDWNLLMPMLEDINK